MTASIAIVVGGVIALVCAGLIIALIIRAVRRLASHISGLIHW